jgi:YfiR/HmsC-like
MQRSSTAGRFRHRCRHAACSGVAGTSAAALLFAGISTLGVDAQPNKPTEYEVKAAYLIDFGKFIRFSGQQPSGPSFDICILGRDAFGQSLDALASNETIDHLPVRILHPDVTQAKSCGIVFISSLEDENIREDLTLLGNAGVLTVSDASDFLQRGGMIQFVLVQNHVRFAVNLDAVNRAHLVISSELLRVASSVTGKPPTGGLP